MRPATRRRRFTFFPVSVRLSAATTMSGMSSATPFQWLRQASSQPGSFRAYQGLPPCARHSRRVGGTSDEKAGDRRLLMDVADGLGHQVGDGQYHDLLAAPLV